MNRKNAGDFWLGMLFAVGQRAPWALRIFRPVVMYGASILSKKVRINTKLNGTRIGRKERGFGRQVVGSFFDFVTDVALGVDASLHELQEQIVAIEGKEEYVSLRKSGRGAVLVTAHMGSFEVGLAALRQVEDKIQVVFKRDLHDGFEKLRAPLRKRLGVTECAIDDGWPVLMGLRDALMRDEVVVMQADRAMGGQKCVPVKIGEGKLQIPIGPVKLARINQTPIVPVFTVRQTRRRFKVYIEPPIDPHDPDAADKIGQALEHFILRYPEQWLVLDAAFVEDASIGVH